VAEVREHEKDALPFRVRRAKQVEPLVPHPRPDVFRAEAVKRCSIGGDAPVVAPARAGDAPPVGFREGRAVRAFEVLEGDFRVTAVEPVGQLAGRCA